MGAARTAHNLLKLAKAVTPEAVRPPAQTTSLAVTGRRRYGGL